MRKIGIVGSRRRNTSDDLSELLAVFKQVYKDGDSIVSGGCPSGGDKFAEDIAKRWGLSITIHYPNLIRNGSPNAFFIRNTLIAEDCTLLIALVHEDRTGGTEDTVKKAIALGKEVIYV